MSPDHVSMRKYLSLSILLPLLFLAGGCGEKTMDEEDGEARGGNARNSPETGASDSEGYDSLAILRERAGKDAALREEGSPIPEASRKAFTGLRYFPVDPKLVFQLELDTLAKPEPFKMAATGGEVRAMRKLGHFRFTVDGQACTLSVFSSESHPEILFVPFRDPTNGEESYEVGRYIDLETRVDNRYLLDFNKAYNPYCAYNPDYTCPVVPNENILPAPIRAGEMVPAAPAH